MLLLWGNPTPMTSISKNNFQFLTKLGDNNNRDWFTKNKDLYLQQHQNTIDFAVSVQEEIAKHDEIDIESGKKILFRIYRDVRFGKDKSPYKTYWGGRFRRSTKLLRGGYYFHIQPGNNFAAGGFWAPNPEDLKRIREEIGFDDTALRKIITSKSIMDTFGGIEGDQVKTAPKGFAKDHKAIDLLRYKQYILVRKFTDEEALSDDFAAQLSDTFRAMRPFFNYMSDILTTDANGELRKDL
jgi:uncharacterized protein (TIGR02453 family)